MSLCDPARSGDLGLLEEARRQLSRAAALALDLRGASARAIASTQWESPAARLFHAEAHEWTPAVARLAATSAIARDDASDEIHRLAVCG